MIWTLVKRFPMLAVLAVTSGAAPSLLAVYLLHLIVRHIQGPDGLNADGELFLLILAALFTASVVSKFITAKYASSLVNNIRESLIRRIVNSRYEPTKEERRSEMYNVITVDVNNLASTLMMLPALTYSLAVIAICFAYLLYLSTALFAALIITFAITAALTAVFFERGRRSGSVVRQCRDSLIRYFEGLVEGQKELAVNRMRRRHFKENRIDPSLGALRTAEYRFLLDWGFYDSISASLVFLMVGALTFWGTMLAPQATVIQYVVILLYVMGPVNDILINVQAFAKASVSLSRIDEWKFVDSESAKWENQLNHSSTLGTWQQIKIRDLRYEYRSELGDRFSVGPISLDIVANNIHVISGGNGSGKSTFVKLLSGLLTADRGSIYVDSTKVEGVDLARYQELFLVLHSDYYLFHDLIDRRGQKDGIDRQARQLLQRFGLERNVQIEESAFSDTMLSAGQKSRLALISALLEDTEVLIFDEWAANQDKEFREIFYREIVPELKNRGKTVIIVSHDDAYYDIADKLYKMDVGTISLTT